MTKSFDMIIWRLANLVYMLVEGDWTVNENTKTLDTVRCLDVELLSRSASSSCFLSRGVTDAHWYISGNLPSSNDSVIRRLMSSANISGHDFSALVGILSRGDDFEGIDRMTVNVSLKVGGRILVNTLPLCLASDCSGSECRQRISVV